MELILTKQTQKELLKLPKSEQKKAVRKLELLGKNQLIGKKLTGKLEVFRSLRFWPYRIIYHIDQIKKKVWIDHIIHRQGAYK
ncbi:MAG: type II toxin-antitoxin system RelE/ParE family toxin [Patescibacteria group bacterium]